MSVLKKNFETSFVLSLPGYPSGARLAAGQLFGDLFAQTVLAFGKYDLFFYYPRDMEQGYEVAMTTRTFCESLPVGEQQQWLEAFKERKDRCKVQVYFSAPPDVKTRAVNPSTRFKFSGPFQNLPSQKLYEVEVILEGEICAELIAEEETLPELSRSLPAEESPETASGDSEEGAKAAQANQVTVDVETLAELVMKVINQRNQEQPKERSARSPVPPGGRMVEQPLSRLHQRTGRYVTHTDLVHHQNQPIQKSTTDGSEKEPVRRSTPLSLR